MTAAPMRIGVVLSAGGLRAAAHLGVLRALAGLGLPIDVLVGVSGGALIASYYAGVGLTVDDMIGDAPVFRGRHVLMFGLMMRLPGRARAFVEPHCGVIPGRIRQLHGARFDRLHHGVKTLAIVCHDRNRGRPCYFSNAEHHGIDLGEAALASAAMPGIFRARPFTIGRHTLQLADGGISDPLPVAYAASDLGATHLVVSDCRIQRFGRAAHPGADIVSIRPELDDTRLLRSPRASLTAAVSAGEAAVTPAIADRLRAWIRTREA